MHCDACDISFTSIHKFFTHRKIHTNSLLDAKTSHITCICKIVNLNTQDCHLHICNNGKYVRPIRAQLQNAQDDNFILKEICLIDTLINYNQTIYGNDKSMTFQWVSLRTEYKIQDLLRNNVTSCLEYKCDICFKVLATKKNLSRHMKIHTGERPFQCDICLIKFTERYVLKRHMKIHSFPLDKPYECDVCLRRFTAKRNLLFHTNLHTGEKPFDCSECGKKFAQLSTYKGHVKSHNRATRTLIKCDLCPRMYLNKKDLKHHQYTHTGEMPFLCKICGERFGQSYKLQRHIKKYNRENQKPYKCDLCPKKFAARQNLKYHQNLHSGEKPYTCQFCAKDFAHRSNLLRHIKIHVQCKEKPYKCESCPKTYFNKQDLKNHVYLHTGEMPYGCKVCDEKYNKRCSLQKHMLTHTERVVEKKSNLLKRTVCMATNRRYINYNNKMKTELIN